jgi:hypothetical protein
MRNHIWRAIRVGGIVENRVAKKDDVVGAFRHRFGHARLRAAQRWPSHRQSCRKPGDHILSL